MSRCRRRDRSSPCRERATGPDQRFHPARTAPAVSRRRDRANIAEAGHTSSARKDSLRTDSSSEWLPESRTTAPDHKGSFSGGRVDRRHRSAKMTCHAVHRLSAEERRRAFSPRTRSRLTYRTLMRFAPFLAAVGLGIADTVVPESQARLLSFSRYGPPSARRTRGSRFRTGTR